MLLNFFGNDIFLITGLSRTFFTHRLIKVLLQYISPINRIKRAPWENNHYKSLFTYIVLMQSRLSLGFTKHSTSLVSIYNVWFSSNGH